MGRREYKLLESYDEWLRGVVDPGHHYRPDPGDEVPVIDIVEDKQRPGQRGGEVDHAPGRDALPLLRFPVRPC